MNRRNFIRTVVGTAALLWMQRFQRPQFDPLHQSDKKVVERVTRITGFSYLGESGCSYMDTRDGRWLLDMTDPIHRDLRLGEVINLAKFV